MPDVFIANNGQTQGRIRTTGVDNTSFLMDRRSSGDSTPDNSPIPQSQQTQEILIPTENPQSINSTEQRNGLLPLFASYWQNPHSIFFETQEPDEQIILFIRKHFITNTPWIFYTVLLLLLPPVVFYVLHILNYSTAFLPVAIIQAIIIMYYLFVLTYAFVKFLEWFYNISIITNKRIMDIQIIDIISKKVSATKITLVQDVSEQQTGAIQSIFNYANILVQTAGTIENFVIESAPNPEQVVKVIDDLIGKEVEVEVPNNAAV